MASLFLSLAPAPSTTRRPLSPTLNTVFSRHFCGIICLPTISSRQKPWMNRDASNLRRVKPVQKTLSFHVARAEARSEKEPMVPPYNVLVTGSSKGIGYALAKEFLKAGDNVIICSRTVDRVNDVVIKLREEFGEQHVWGTACDVRQGNDVKALVEFARDKLKHIDIWINNAGSNAYSYKPLTETSDEDLMEVVTTNTLGLMICCREAIKMMSSQPRGGHIFNIDGAGSDGRPTPRFAAYGATKRSVVHLTKSLQAELRMNEVKNVMVHNLSAWLPQSFSCLGRLQNRQNFSSMFLRNQQKWLQNIWSDALDQLLAVELCDLLIFASSLD
ncbi:chlorophyll(ide) b reductase NOL, chloroplastic isoform X2 [Amborella trichopoda]|uniref:chlorophyll(ide) b reductase NOL, chloroplastic isoform X2 n=1 Tax=Amborella trichopoda TaxID=13333 RepID=UPI0009C168BF|nr:chlorophyll(ide) b reductase NOL, chloroplastic isoform X2 [Amborella trichopoda]|eukprot:XP_020530390.1 chlorophyll(ide) b reductase NOL, chloroplastic isoform X2 [Amborella trichopoda]